MEATAGSYSSVRARLAFSPCELSGGPHESQQDREETAPAQLCLVLSCTVQNEAMSQCLGKDLGAMPHCSAPLMPRCWGDSEVQAGETEGLEIVRGI